MSKKQYSLTYIGKLRFLEKSVSITKDDVVKVSKKYNISVVEAKKMIIKDFIGDPILQQFDGHHG